MKLKLGKKDLMILKLLQENCKLTAREIAKEINSPITTVFAKIKRMESLGLIKNYKAILDAKMLEKGTTAFVLASFTYGLPEKGSLLSQRKIAEQISKLPEAQEVHIITGNWDILIKVKAKDVDDVGKFIVDELRKIKGIEKTLTCMVFDTTKESLDINL